MAKQELEKWYGEAFINDFQSQYKLPENAMIFNYADKTIQLLPEKQQLQEYLQYVISNHYGITGAISYYSNTLREFRCWIKDEEQKQFDTLPDEEEEFKNVPPSGTLENNSDMMQPILDLLVEIKELCKVSANEELLIKLYDKTSDIERTITNAKQKTTKRKAEYSQVEELRKQVENLLSMQVREEKKEQIDKPKISNNHLIATDHILQGILILFGVLIVFLLFQNIFN